jgi:hypothetical protein
MDEKSIEDWCSKLGLKNYEIIDGVVNVNGNVNISWKGLTEIPIKFGIVTAEFNCSVNKLTSLEGSPEIVYNNFTCDNNQLITLEGAPKEVGGHFFCYNNKLISLDGGPNKVDGWFNCASNPIWKEYTKYNNYKEYMRSVKLKELLK